MFILTILFYHRKKRGQEPTGMLYYKAKAAGYSSVSKFLHADGHEKFGPLKSAKDDSGYLKKQGASGEGKVGRCVYHNDKYIIKYLKILISIIFIVEVFYPMYISP